MTPTLKLAFKSFLVGIAVFHLRTSHFTFGWTLIFFILFGLFYLRPLIGERKFLVSAITFLVLIFYLPVTPEEELSIAAFAGIIFYLLIAIKNLIYLKREAFYNILHSIFIMGLSSAFLKGLPAFIVFFLLLLIFHEFYSVSTEIALKKNWLISAIGGILITQFLWLISLLPINFLLAGALSVLLALIFHDLVRGHFEGKISAEIVLRDVSLFIVISIIILLGARWTL